MRPRSMHMVHAYGDRVHWVALQAQEYLAQVLVGAEEHIVQECAG
jgi:hypothetical protein